MRVVYEPPPALISIIDTILVSKSPFGPESSPFIANTHSPITNTPADAVKAGHWMQEKGDAAPLWDQIWTEVKGK